MARVTLDDCLKLMSNRFEIIDLASERARQIYNREGPMTKRKEAPTVTALREIAAGTYPAQKTSEPEQNFDIDDNSFEGNVEE